MVATDNAIGKRATIMVSTAEYATNERPPACARCGGTGFVYLWSIAVDGSRRWFCDRSGCKIFWGDAGRRALAIASGGVMVPEVQAVVPIADQSQLLPV
jgi:hypothetical protein